MLFFLFNIGLLNYGYMYINVLFFRYCVLYYFFFINGVGNIVVFIVAKYFFDIFLIRLDRKLFIFKVIKIEDFLW